MMTMNTQDTSVNETPDLDSGTEDDPVSFEEYLRRRHEPSDEDLKQPIERCPDCGGELADPVEIEAVKRAYLHYQPHTRCTCPDDPQAEQNWREYTAGVRERWLHGNDPKLESILKKISRDYQSGTPQQRAKWDAWNRKVESKCAGAVDPKTGAIKTDAEESGLLIIESAADSDAAPLMEPHRVIEGVLHVGCKMVLGGESKAKKTWSLIDLGFATATGGKWWNHFQCNQGSVLYLNFELIPWEFQKRRLAISAARRIRRDKLNAFHFVNLKGKAQDIKRLTGPIIDSAASGKYALIILDPIYKVLGGRDENAAGAMTELVNHLEEICFGTGAAIAFAHHFPKGDISGRKAMDKLSGSGVFSRDPEAIVTMSPKEVELPSIRDMENMDPAVRAKLDETAAKAASGNFFDVDAIVRNFPGFPRFEVGWEYPVFHSVTEEEREKRAEDAAERKRHAEEQERMRAVAMLRQMVACGNSEYKNGVPSSKWKTACGYSTRNDAWVALVQDLESQGLAKRTKPNNRQSPWVPA